MIRQQNSSADLKKQRVEMKKRTAKPATIFDENAEEQSLNETSVDENQSNASF